MGNCVTNKNNAASHLEPASEDLGKQSKSMVSTQSDGIKTRVDTLEMNPGEEELYSKAININHFDIIRVIGRGSFGKVFLVQKKDTMDFYAMKVLKKEAISTVAQRAHTISERKILQIIDSPFIVKLHYAFQNPDKLYFVMDFLNGGEMFTHLRKKVKFSEKRARFYAAEMILALKCLHDNGVLYRDLKPENIILGDDGHIKITDFGLSKMNLSKEEDQTYTFCGTPEYLAPEIILQKGHDKTVDWWSLGTILYEMLSGRPPFFGKNKRKVLQEAIHSPILMKKSFSVYASDLLSKLLERNPKKRLGYGTKGALDIMDHPFFEPIDWDKLAKKEVKPPYVPKTRKKDDLRHIDPMFLDEKVQETPADSNLDVSDKTTNHFEKFTYCKDGHISQNIEYNSDDEGLSNVLEDDEYYNGALSDENGY